MVQNLRRMFGLCTTLLELILTTAGREASTQILRLESTESLIILVLGPTFCMVLHCRQVSKKKMDAELALLQQLGC